MTETKREQIKLRAAYYNGVAIGLSAVGTLGIVVPIVSAHMDAWSIGSGFVALAVLGAISIAIREIGVSALNDLDRL